MTPLDHSTIERFRALLLQRQSLYALAAFGSRTRSLVNDAIPSDSDLDVLVVTETMNPEIRRFVSDCAFEAGFDAGIVLSPVVYSREEWENSPEAFSPLARSIRAEGTFFAL